MSSTESVAADHMEDWTLEAIVRGTSVDFCHTATNGLDHFFDEDLHDNQYHQMLDFPSIFEGGSCIEELEELYKPFYNNNNNNNNNSELPPAGTVIDFQQRPEDDVAEDKPAVDQSTGTSCVARATAGAGYTPKYKRRKNQHKRVVMQVSAEGLASDMWAWRKYGQKPIKGSPYPRSYYRCSSSKGCLARKQVEQSFTDEGMFIVTYTAEHSHSQPTRRNSLAGTVRQKFPSHQNNKNIPPAKTPAIKVPEKTEESTKVIRARIKEEENRADESISNGLIMSDFAYDEDFFSGFKDFDEDCGFELPMDDAYRYYDTQQYPVMSNCSSWL